MKHAKIKKVLSVFMALILTIGSVILNDVSVHADNLNGITAITSSGFGCRAEAQVAGIVSNGSTAIWVPGGPQLDSFGGIVLEYRENLDIAVILLDDENDYAYIRLYFDDIDEVLRAEKVRGTLIARNGTPYSTYIGRPGESTIVRLPGTGLQAIGIINYYFEADTGRYLGYLTTGFESPFWHSHMGFRYLVLTPSMVDEFLETGVFIDEFDFHGEIIITELEFPYGELRSRLSLREVILNARSEAAAQSDDTPSDWANWDVSKAIELGFVPFELQSNFMQAITHAEFASLIDAFYETVTWREGFEHEAFDFDIVTREQAAVMLVRLADAVGQSLPQATTARWVSLLAFFSDSAEISPWAVEAVGQMWSVNIMNGNGGSIFAPQDNLTREQAIVTMLRLLRLMGGLDVPPAG
ncbi:MAG: S-layer homology domain-containing protein [Defluviitaleaceae bacterium]|nr:S-layer homology domain-containing protein [Defluviitaleaceae bacterium]